MQGHGSTAEVPSLGRVGIAIVVMVVMVIAVNFVFWRPMVAWAERFRAEESAAAERPAASSSTCCAAPWSPTS